MGQLKVKQSMGEKRQLVNSMELQKSKKNVTGKFNGIATKERKNFTGKFNGVLINAEKNLQKSI